MTEDESRARPMDEQEVADAITEYMKQHPAIREALEVFQVSQESYQASIKALQRRPVHSSNSANETALLRS